MASIMRKSDLGHMPSRDTLLEDWLKYGAEPHGICASTILEGVYSNQAGSIESNIRYLVEREVRRQLKEYEPVLKRLKKEGEAFENNVQFMGSLMQKKARRSKNKKFSGANKKLFENYDDFEEYLKSCD